MSRTALVSHLITIPEGVGANLEGNTVTLTKDGNSLTRDFNHNRVKVRQADGGLTVTR